MNWKAILKWIITIVVFALTSKLLEIDFQMLLLLSIAFDLLCIRNNMEDE